jgi:iron(III) transport system permease protein
VGLGALVPTAWLARLAILRGDLDLGALAGPLGGSLLLATTGAAVTLLLSALIAAGARSGGGRIGLFAGAIGYAAPGAVTALGALTIFAAAREAGLVGGLGAVTSIALLLWVYASRFAAAGAQPLEAGLSRVSRSMRDAARTLDGDGTRRFLSVDLPVAAPSAIAASLIVFVEILKELPATLILRPFDLETLAVRAYAYAADERLTQAATPALAITLAGLAPVIFLSRALSKSRAGAAP